MLDFDPATTARIRPRRFFCSDQSGEEALNANPPTTMEDVAVAGSSNAANGDSTSVDFLYP
ncbi:MAG: hypothetical protein ABIV50_11865 [Opitutus sp.]